MTQLFPIRDRIVVKRDEQMTQTPSGLFIPDTNTSKPDRGTVLAVGTGRVKPDGSILEMEIKAGDVIIFAKGAGQVVKVDNEELLIMTEADVLSRVQ